MSEQKPAEEKAPDSNDNLMDHEYDGIKEYDNPLPRWWVWIFWGSIVFAFGYFFHFQISHKGLSVLGEYQADEAEANAKAAAVAMKSPTTEETLATVLADGAAVEEGKKIFTARCVPCHGDRGQGTIGPNLTDNRWIHGKGKLMDIYGVVSTGVAIKGMPDWSKQLSPTELKQVVAFVGSIRNTNLPGKAPEGEEAASP